VPAVQGGGKLQQAILAQLDGQPRYARDIIAELVGGTPTPAQYNAAHRAARSLITQGRVRGWLGPGQHHPLVLLKVGRWVGDHDGGTFTERQQAVDPLADFTDEAWRAFATDCGYATDICQAAVALARSEHRDPAAPGPVQAGPFR
jgi:hypothetical protein